MEAMWTPKELVDLIRQCSLWTHTAAREDPSSLWKLENADAETRPAYSVGIFSAFTTALTSASRAAQKTAENTLRNPNIVEADHPHTTKLPPQKVQAHLDRLGRRYRRLMRTRDEVLEVRTQEQIEWAKCADMRRFYLESQERFMEQADVLLSAPDPSSVIEHLQQLHRQTRADLNAMKVQAEITRNLENRLSSMHFHIHRRDEDFIDSCHAMMKFWPLPWGPEAMTAPSVKAVSSSASPVTRASGDSTLHPTLQTYYETVGDIGLIGEELANLDIEYEETRAVRLFITERDDSLSVSNSEFEKDYAHARAQIEQRLSLAIQEANELRKRCIEEGLGLTKRDNAESIATDDLLLDRRSDVLASEDVPFDHVLLTDLSNWRMVGLESRLYDGPGPAFPDPDRHVDDKRGLCGPRKLDGPNTAPRPDILRWASQIPEGVKPIGPESNVPDLDNGADQMPGVALPNLRKPSQVMALRSPSSDSNGRSPRPTVQDNPVAISVPRSRVPPRHEGVRLLEQDQGSSRTKQDDRIDPNEWKSGGTPRHRDNLGQLRRRHSFGVDARG